MPPEDEPTPIGTADTDTGGTRTVAISFRQHAVAGMADPERHNREVDREIAELNRQLGFERRCEQRVHAIVQGLPVRRGHAPRAATNQRRRGSRRASGIRSSQDPGDADADADSDRLSLALAGGAG